MNLFWETVTHSANIVVRAEKIIVMQFTSELLRRMTLPCQFAIIKLNKGRKKEDE